MSKNLQFSSLFLVTTAILGISGSGASAASINFQTGTDVGDVSPSPNQASLSTNALQGDDFPELDGNFNFSGNPAIDAFALENAIGLTPGTLDPDPGNFIFAFEGSAISFDLNVDANDVLSVDWNFQTNEQGQLSKNDYGFIAVNDQVTILADVNDATQTSGSNFALETGTNSFSLLFPSAGNNTISFGVLDVEDGSESSALILSDLDVSPSPVNVTPEPGVTISLLGLGVVALINRRKKTNE